MRDDVLTVVAQKVHPRDFIYPTGFSEIA